jgi:hypothetical protein
VAVCRATYFATSAIVVAAAVFRAASPIALNFDQAPTCCCGHFPTRHGVDNVEQRDFLGGLGERHAAVDAPSKYNGVR